MIFSSISRVRALLLVLALALTPSLIHAQQAKPIEPCPAAPDSKKIIAAVDCDPPRASRKLVDESIPDDADVLKLLEPYRSKVSELETVIGRLDGELKRTRPGGGTLGNFITDGLRSEASRRLKKPVLLTISNYGGMRRSSIPQGPLRVRDVWELLPFENALIVIDLTGAQLQKLLQGVLASDDAQSGARLTYRQNPNEKAQLISASFLDRNGKETRIDPNAVYSIVTIDYLYELNSGNYSILREGRNMHPLGVTLRDAMIEYVKGLNARGVAVRPTVDDRFKQVGPATGAQEEK